MTEDLSFKETEYHHSFSCNNVNESSINQSKEMSKRNFYLQLFRTYSELPYLELLENFVSVYNDVFIKEKPITV
jgi:hypothetical protein